MSGASVGERGFLQLPARGPAPWKMGILAWLLSLAGARVSSPFQCGMGDRLPLSEPSCGRGTRLAESCREVGNLLSESLPKQSNSGPGWCGSVD